MVMRLHTNSEEYRDLIRLTAESYHLEKFYNDAEKLANMVELVKAAEKNSRFKDAYPYEEKWFKAPLVNILDNKKIEKAYEENFGAEFVYGELPKFELIKEKIRSIISVLATADL